jgi:hypothetical protein
MKTLPPPLSPSSSNSQLVRSLADPLSFSHVSAVYLNLYFILFHESINLLVKKTITKFGMYFLSNTSEYFSKNGYKDIYMFSVLIPLLLNPSNLRSNHQSINPPFLHNKSYYIS